MGTILRTVDWTDYDWRSAAAEAGLRPDDVARVVAAVTGENDGDSWLCAFEFNTGAYGFLSAGCDYTGWDCSASGTLDYAPSLSELCRLHMGETDRFRLGFDVFGNEATNV